MQLSSLAQSFAPQVRLAHGAADAVVGRACFDSRRVQPGDLYCALPGTACHGVEFLAQAKENGAAAWLVSANSGHPSESNNTNLQAMAELPRLEVVGDANVVQVAGEIAAELAGQPSQAMHLSAVTGTNGKSTIVHLLEQAWNHNHVAAGRVGTLGFCFGGEETESLNTTPSADQLHDWMRRIQQQGAKAVALEASSHGIHQQRLAGAEINAIGWTNLSHDHLDYHGNLESYAAAKAALIHDNPNATALLPADDPRIWQAQSGAKAQCMSWSLIDPPSAGQAQSSADLWATYQASDNGIELHINGVFGSGLLRSSMIGRHNGENLLLAFGLLRLSGMSVEQSLYGLSQAGAAPGRLQRVAPQSPWHLFVDYAHTPEALRSVLQALRNNYADRRIGIVCGAGGDRDPIKRGPMGEAAVQGADWCMLTSDNPRTENPDAILDAVVAGAEAANSGKEILRQVDRHLAIQKAVARLHSGDVLLVAGKGHEPYQEIMGVRYPFDDRLELEEAVKCCS